MTEADARRCSPESYPELAITDEVGPNKLPTAIIYADDWKRLPEYSSTMPTGVFYGKRWKRNVNDRRSLETNWVIGGYEPHEDETKATIVWFDVMVVERCQ